MCGVVYDLGITLQEETGGTQSPPPSPLDFAQFCLVILNQVLVSSLFHKGGLLALLSLPCIMSAPNCSSRKTSTLSFRKIPLFQVLLTLLFITQNVHIRRVKAECSTDGTYGCPLTAVDIWYGDSHFKEALSFLRRYATKLSDNDDADVDAINRALATLKVAGDEKRTLLTLRGMKGGRLEDQINQDRALMVSPFHILAPGSNSNSDSNNSRLPSAQLLGVFDGHGGGGELTSNYAMENFPSLLAAKLATIYIKDSDDNDSDNDFDPDLSIVQALKEVFIDVDRKDPSKKWNGGSTATVVLQIGHKLFVANAGDRYVYLCLIRKTSICGSILIVCTTLSHTMECTIQH